MTTVETCQDCGKKNHVCHGDQDDQTAVDVDGFRCWACGHVRLFVPMDSYEAEWAAECGGFDSVEDWAERGAMIEGGNRPGE